MAAFTVGSASIWTYNQSNPTVTRGEESNKISRLGVCGGGIL
jgi:hypothetical protein